MARNAFRSVPSSTRGTLPLRYSAYKLPFQLCSFSCQVVDRVLKEQGVSDQILVNRARVRSLWRARRNGIIKSGSCYRVFCSLVRSSSRPFPTNRMRSVGSSNGKSFRRCSSHLFTSPRTHTTLVGWSLRLPRASRNTTRSVPPTVQSGMIRPLHPGRGL